MKIFFLILFVSSGVFAYDDVDCREDKLKSTGIDVLIPWVDQSPEHKKLYAGIYAARKKYQPFDVSKIKIEL